MAVYREQEHFILLLCDDDIGKNRKFNDEINSRIFGRIQIN